MYIFVPSQNFAGGTERHRTSSSSSSIAANATAIACCTSLLPPHLLVANLVALGDHHDVAAPAPVLVHHERDQLLVRLLHARPVRGENGRVRDAGIRAVSKERCVDSEILS